MKTFEVRPTLGNIYVVEVDNKMKHEDVYLSQREWFSKHTYLDIKDMHTGKVMRFFTKED